MQLNKKIIFVFIMCLSNLACANLEILINGISCDVDFSSRSEIEKVVIRKIGLTFSENNIDSGVSCLAWSGLDTTNNWFELSSDLDLYGVNIETKEYLGSWPLTSWPSHLFLEGEYTAAVEDISGVHGGDYSANGDPLFIIEDYKVLYHFDNESFQTFRSGCYQKAPLRFGDVDGDNQSELVLMLGKKIVIFSPQEKNITFSAHYWLDDEIASGDLADIFPGEIPETKAQYVASSGADHLVREIYPAKRSISKLYFNDFDNNGKTDIVLWRKMYESNLRNEGVKGFHKLSEGVFHYERNEIGQYQLKTDTQSDTAKAWLEAKNLTWQKGFPSKSECAGQEGQLIPEMHDSLLNDPDVLK